MRLKLLLCSLILTSSMLVAPIAANAASNKIHVLVGNSEVHFTNDPLIQNGHTLVEFRPIFEALGLKVIWDEADQQVVGYKDGLQIILTIGSDEAIVNGFKKKLDIAPQILNGRTLIPARFVGESSGEKVSWNGDTETVSITGNLANDDYLNPIYLNGVEMFQIGKYDFNPVILNSTLFVSGNTLRKLIGEDSIKYNIDNGDFTLTHGDKSMRISVSQNGVQDGQITVHSGLSYFPLKYIVESLGGTYNEDSNGIQITLN